MSLVKIPFIVTSAILNHIAWTAPHPATAREEKQVSGFIRKVFENNVRWYPTVDKVVMWTWSICECSAIYAATNKTNPLAKQIAAALTFGGSLQNIHLTQTYFTAWSVIVLGGILRMACFHALGRFFTFELTVRDHHKLITYGPYGYVRHPSYTALIFVKFATIACMAGPGSWTWESGAWDTIVGRCMLVWWMIWAGWAAFGLTMRTVKEDDMMKTEFGEQWDRWAQRVRYRLFPGIF